MGDGANQVVDEVSLVSIVRHLRPPCRRPVFDPSKPRDYQSATRRCGACGPRCVLLHALTPFLATPGGVRLPRRTLPHTTRGPIPAAFTLHPAVAPTSCQPRYEGGGDSLVITGVHAQRQLHGRRTFLPRESRAGRQSAGLARARVSSGRRPAGELDRDGVRLPGGVGPPELHRVSRLMGGEQVGERRCRGDCLPID